MVFFGAIANCVAGDRLFLRADGLVLLDRAVISATARIEVTEVAVRPGQAVARGAALMRAESLETLGRLAELAVREAEMDERGARLRSELQMARALHPRVARRLDDLRTRGAALAELDSARLVSVTRREDLADTLHAAEVDAARLAAEIEGLSAEIAALDQTRGRARDAIRDLRARYREGLHSAGIVGDRVPAPGEVFNPGDPILTLDRGDPYGFAYLPRGYLFEPAAGTPVAVSTGTASRPGRVQAVRRVGELRRALPHAARHVADRARRPRHRRRPVSIGGRWSKIWSGAPVRRGMPLSRTSDHRHDGIPAAVFPIRCAEGRASRTAGHDIGVPRRRATTPVAGHAMKAACTPSPDEARRCLVRSRCPTTRAGRPAPGLFRPPLPRSRSRSRSRGRRAAARTRCQATGTATGHLRPSPRAATSAEPPASRSHFEGPPPNAIPRSAHPQLRLAPPDPRI